MTPLISAGGATTEVKIHWGDEDPGNTSSGWDKSISLGNLVPGKFSWDISEGFAPPKVYHARFEAINSAGSTWSTPLHFAASASKSPNITSTSISDLALWLDASDIDGDGHQMAMPKTRSFQHGRTSLVTAMTQGMYVVIPVTNRQLQQANQPLISTVMIAFGRHRSSTLS